ncbi:MAG: site-2 protease family protein [Candidatus Thermoplasmatota archaeon]|jgi:membrane-associated protease RseP (regulator of RpoE activity)|nr:site-2 protease family protein [Candidatus Thermoplasmatota archaeon]
MPEPWNNPNQTPIESPFDLELLQREVGSRFPFYDMKTNINTVAFFCRIDEETLEEKFESLRRTLLEKQYIPMVRNEHGEQIIYVVKKPPSKKPRSVWINIILLIATIFTTTLAGALQWVDIDQVDWMNMFAMSYLWQGLIFFSVPLLLILGVHEMGHYYASKKHHVDASLPYFIPLPPPFLLGTFGALISTHEPIPNRKALLDIGVAGPLCGFLVAIPISLIGFFLMQQSPIPLPTNGTNLSLMPPLLLQWMQSLFLLEGNYVIHPTLFAGWVGIFLTAVNLLPAGQLDGGHVARAILKEKHKYISWVVIFILAALSFFYTGWLMFAIIILLFIGTQHQPPLNELTPLDTRRKLLGLAILLIFILSFAPIPFGVE